MILKKLALLFALIYIVSLKAYPKFSHESEASIVQLAGNTELETYNGKTTNVYQAEAYTLGFGGHYTLGTAGEFETARNWDINAKAGKVLNPQWDTNLGVVYEGNEFAGFETRTNVDVGGTWKMYALDSLKQHFDIGYRYTDEKPINDLPHNRDSKIRLYAERDQKIQENLSYKIWLEYLPNLTTPEDYQISFEPSMQVAINQTFALKVAYKGMYDNVPAAEGLERFDSVYTTSLIAKF
jgi:putative salt-induced outer membrane protein